MTRTSTDVMGELLRRFSKGPIRPLWADLTPERKAPWLNETRLFIAKAEAEGLIIEVKETQHG